MQTRIQANTYFSWFMRPIFILLLTLFLAFSVQAKNTVQDYQRLFLPVYLANGELRIAIRVFKMNDIPSFLLVNPNRLTTEVMPITNLSTKDIKPVKKKGYFTYWNLGSTRYYQLLNKSTAAPYLQENQGITHADKLKKGNVLTIDLCPSSKPFEKEFFQSLVQLAERSQKPIPLTLAISGLWLIEHPDEFNWLLEKQKENKFAITWANHSFSHVFYLDLPYSENFLLSAGTNPEVEILLTEKYLLEAGQVPSVFFRFPGLISDKKLVKTLKEHGLISLGADAWIAKGQAIRPGGIILVHGNGNEPDGIQDLNLQLQRLEFHDIKEAL